MTSPFGRSTRWLALWGSSCLVLALATPVATQGPGSRGGATVTVNGAEAVAGDVLVKFAGALDAGARQQLDSQMDADRDEEVGGIGVRRIHSRTHDIETLVAFLRTNPSVVYAEPNYVVRAIAVPNDPRFGELWGLRNTGQTVGGVAGTPGADISATAAWDISTGTRATVVAIVDTGIDYNHPDLAANVWSAPAAFTVNIGGRAITCAAGTHGFNAINNTCNPMDDNNHGSHVSGTIGAVGNNGVGVAGVNWIASLMGAKFLSASGSGTTADAINAIEFTIQAKAAFGANGNVGVLSNSWGGGGFSQALLDEINKANTNNMLFVAAAGNSSADNDVTPHYPSSYNAPNVISVAATDNQDLLASFSNYGRTSVHLGAPGVNVLSTTPNNTYSSFSGTSMATPHVSGAAALVLAVCPLNTASLKSNLLTNVDPIASMASVTVTGGRLNVNKAIRACSAPPAPDFSVSATPPSQTVTQGASTTYTVTVTPSGGFSGSVTFSASGLPAGASASFNPASVTSSGSSTMTVTTSSTTPAASYPLTVTGTSGTLTRTAAVTLVVTAPGAGDFTVSASPTSRTVDCGFSTTYTVTVARTGSFTGGVGLSVSGLPAGATGAFSPNPATGTSSTLTVTVSTTTLGGTYPLTITGTSGSLTRTTAVTLVTGNDCDGNQNP